MVTKIHASKKGLWFAPTPTRINGSNLKGEFHSNLWNLTFINKSKYSLILQCFVFKVSKVHNRSWDIYVFSNTKVYKT